MKPRSKKSDTSPVPSEALDALGHHAVRYVRQGQTIGLGTGRAANAFIHALAAAKFAVRGVATSNVSAELARALGIELIELSDTARIDTDFDGADEVDPRLNMIKGWGGAMVREKIVAAASRKRIFLVGEEKIVPRLGSRGSLPVEIVPFAFSFASRAIARLGLKPHPRVNHDGSWFVTDNGNRVINFGVKEINNPARLERELLSIPGVVGTGLFLGIADMVLVAMRDGSIKTLRRTAKS
ncbi:MAG TPA: ribose-5-phosphate isomerase RpiA [Candidatus Binataceae bacterium]|nr:ribose-5-phosphate isomerase RpiA [Candidatus Binataceae bacterium]